MGALRYNLVQTELNGAHTSGTTTLNFLGPLQEGGVDIATLGAGEFLRLKVDDEIMHLTSYTEAALSGTVLRAQGGTVAAAHDDGAAVRHVATKDDYTGGYLRLRRSGITFAAGSQSVNWASPTLSEVVGDAFDISSNVPRILKSGIYAVTAGLEWPGWATEGTYRSINVYDDATEYFNLAERIPVPASGEVWQTMSGVFPVETSVPDPVSFDFGSDGTADGNTGTVFLTIVRLG